MRGASGVLCVVVAALLVYCSADPHQGYGVAGRYGELYGNSAEKARSPDPIDGGNLVRRRRSNDEDFMPLAQLLYSRLYDRSDLNQSPKKRNFDEIDHTSMPFAYVKRVRNFRPNQSYLSGLNNVLKKRNMDEIDQGSMPSSYAKRFSRNLGPNHSYLSSFDKKRYRGDYPMDEIDLSHFPIGS